MPSPGVVAGTAGDADAAASSGGLDVTQAAATASDGFAGAGGADGDVAMDDGVTQTDGAGGDNAAAGASKQKEWFSWNRECRAALAAAIDAKNAAIEAIGNRLYVVVCVL